MAVTQIYGDKTEAYPDLRWTLALREDELYQSLLVDWFGREYRRRLVSKRGTVWFVKCKDEKERKRDKLAALLGAGWLNIAAVELLSPTQFSDILSIGIELPVSATCNDTYLVRFASDYFSGELPIDDPDQALASELVFSLWIRRRDAHSYNRAYTAGLPVFFDCGVAFLGEPHLARIDQFFQTGPDPGYAGLWRIRSARPRDLNTTMQRRLENESFQSEAGDSKVFFPIVNRNTFIEGLHSSADHISEFNLDYIKCMIDDAGFKGDEAIDIFKLLKKTRNQIRYEIQYLSSRLTETA